MTHFTDSFWEDIRVQIFWLPVLSLRKRLPSRLHTPLNERSTESLGSISVSVRNWNKINAAAGTEKSG